jgi:two-component system, NarL family, sensor kinase
MPKPLSALVLCLLLCFSINAQNPTIDSLEKQLTTTLPDSMRALSMMRLAVNLETIDTLKSMQVYNATLAFAISKKLYHRVGLTYFNQSFLFSKEGRHDDAKIRLDSSLFYLEKSTAADVLFRRALVYGELANNARFRNEFQKSIEYHMKAASMLEKMDKPANLVIVYLNISTFYKEQNEFAKQEAFARKALTIAGKTGNPSDLFKSYVFLALALNMQEKYTVARNVIDSCLNYYSDQNDPELLTTYYLTAGLTYMNMNQLDSAMRNFSQSLAIGERNMNAFEINQSKLQVGRVLTMQRKFSEAEPMLLSTTAQMRQTREFVQLQIALDYLARLYEESGDYAKALKYQKEFKSLSDSLSTEKSKEFASRLEVSYETAKKEAKISALEDERALQRSSIRQKNLLNYILIASIVTFLLIAVLLYRNYIQKQKLQQQQIRELETANQLNATEAVLKGEEQERTRLAKDLHDGLGGLLSGIKYSFSTMKGNLVMTPDNAEAFERSMDMLDSSILEMRRVAHNMMPEALVKFGLDAALKDFCHDITQSGALNVSYQSINMNDLQIEQTTAITIFRIVQELINNTMKHAGAKNAIVQLSKSGENLSLTVEDDGKGFDTSMLERADGIGWNNIRNRVEFLKGKLDVHSAPGKGTSVLVEFRNE